MPKYNKLVRDHIPDLIKITGKNPVVRTLGEEEYAAALRRKLREETSEYINADNNREAVKELADVLEVVHALAAVQGLTTEELEDVRANKEKERGGFHDRVYLLEVNNEA